jgi:hypothetical protein
LAVKDYKRIMAIEDDVETLKTQVQAIQDTLDSWTSSINAIAGKAPLNSPAFTGNPTAATQAVSDDSTRLATTAFVKVAITDKAPLNSPAFTGNPTAATQGVSDNSGKLATTAFVQAALATLTGTGTPQPPAAITGSEVSYTEQGQVNNQQSTGSAGTAPSYARTDHQHPGDTTRAPIESPNFIGEPTVPYPEFSSYESAGDEIGTVIANVDFVINYVAYAVKAAANTGSGSGGSSGGSEEAPSISGDFGFVDNGGGKGNDTPGSGGGAGYGDGWPIGTSTPDAGSGTDGGPGEDGALVLKVVPSNPDYDGLDWSIPQ